jgi:ribosome-binding factor A
LDISRIDRLQSQMLRALAAVVDEELKDKPPHMLTFTRTEISKDLRYAKVYFSVLGGGEEIQACMSYLKRHGGIIKKMLSPKMRMKHMPEIQYLFDEAVANVARVGEILERLKKESDEK